MLDCGSGLGRRGEKAACAQGGARGRHPWGGSPSSQDDGFALRGLPALLGPWLDTRSSARAASRTRHAHDIIGRIAFSLLPPTWVCVTEDGAGRAYNPSADSVPYTGGRTLRCATV